MNNELRKNAEGYTDPTAAATLNRKEAGDIWEYKGGECLILKNHPGFATILKLHDTNEYSDRIEVGKLQGGPHYVDPAFIITGRYNDMGKYVETLDAVSFGRVLSIVADTMGLVIEPTEKADTATSDETTQPVGDDLVNHPTHYTSGGVECIDAIRASMTPEEFKGFLKGNAMKYLWRYRLKGKPAQDLEKANWYLSRLTQVVE